MLNAKVIITTSLCVRHVSCCSLHLKHIKIFRSTQGIAIYRFVQSALIYIRETLIKLNLKNITMITLFVLIFSLEEHFFEQLKYRC